LINFQDLSNYIAYFGNLFRNIGEEISPKWYRLRPVSATKMTLLLADNIPNAL